MTEAFDPGEALGMIEDEESRVRRALAVNLPVQLLAWGVAWLVGFLALWLDVRAHSSYTPPGTLSSLVFFALLLVAGVVTAIATTRATRGVGGRTARTGARLGLGWGVGYGGFVLVAGGVAVYGTPEAASVMMTAGAVLIAGLMYLLSGAVWDDPLLVRLGVGIIAVGGVASWTGPVWAPLVAGVAGGGGLLVAAGLAVARRRRA
ncbi:hypothetical protein PCC79_11255 [Propioniciclava soli]|uniref:Transporter n=1 Tax=Propioniciclava soli TaxID=2775081 RepID=A0ABZ3C3S4_9ACTN